MLRGWVQLNNTGLLAATSGLSCLQELKLVTSDQLACGAPLRKALSRLTTLECLELDEDRYATKSVTIGFNKSQCADRNSCRTHRRKASSVDCRS